MTRCQNARSFRKNRSSVRRSRKGANDIALWKNKLEFFSRSSNAEKVRDEFNEKIAEAADHLKYLNEQLNC